jgi:hypothetical protein
MVRRPVRSANLASAATSGSALARCQVLASGCSEACPGQVRRDHAGAHRELAQPQRRGPVPAHHRPVLDRLGAEVGQLGVALGQDHAERAQAAHRQEPAGRRHVRGGGAAQHAEQEAGRHEQQLEHRGPA